MNIEKELDGEPREILLAARLAVAFTFLNLAPFDSWGHEGDPAEMAAYVVKIAKARGQLYAVEQAMGLHHRLR